MRRARGPVRTLEYAREEPPVIFDSLLGMFSVDMGIDLGTCNTLVCVRGEGIVLNEPSVVAVRKGTNRVLRRTGLD